MTVPAPDRLGPAGRSAGVALRFVGDELIDGQDWRDGRPIRYARFVVENSTSASVDFFAPAVNGKLTLDFPATSFYSTRSGDAWTDEFTLSATVAYPGSSTHSIAPGTSGEVYVALQPDIFARDPGTRWKICVHYRSGDSDGRSCAFPLTFASD